MFSLIITIISIALVAALALATLYYGGTAFNKGAAGADAARLINEGQQINGAVAMYKADEALDGATANVTTIAGLVASPGNYLSQVPASFVADAADIADGQVTAPASNAVCDEVNKRSGLTTRPLDQAAATAAGNVFGCFGAAGAAGTFWYKF